MNTTMKTGEYLPEKKKLWGIILAGGEGIRLQQFVRESYGISHPKQFCSIIGKRSMLQHTFDRGTMLIPQNQIMTVVNPHHVPYIEEQLHNQPDDTIITQPYSRDTGPAILLSLLHIHHRDPDATVVIFPSDHFILNEAKFMEHVQSAFLFAHAHPEFGIVLGYEPDRPEREYGWIEPSKDEFHLDENMFCRVKRFWEKPQEELTEVLFLKECLWNTMVIVANVNTFLSWFELHSPELYEPFHTIKAAFNTKHISDVTREVFQYLEPVNFSREILERIESFLCVLKLNDVYWSDWGNEHQIRTDMVRFNLHPAKPFTKDPAEQFLQTLQYNKHEAFVATEA